MMAVSSRLGGGDDGNLDVDLGRLIPISRGGADCLADGLGDGDLAGQGVGLGGDGRALNGVGAAAKSLAAGSEGRVGNTVDDGLLARDDVAGEAAAELATGSNRHELPAAEVSARGGGGSGADSENSRK
ncbi:hypothetical protein F5B21DRAFT_483569 [Xylaria acuta]|nr:hypothetical protein F5B21DRAFT_483569 [Xylaria acuta]